VGNSLTFFLHYVFGAHRFGPYFLVVLALAITLCLGLKLRLSVIADFARAIARAIAGGSRPSCRNYCCF